MLVINTCNHMSERFLERSNRFITSLNKPDTIKADVFILWNGSLIYLQDKSEWLDQAKTFKFQNSYRTIDSLKEFARKHEYVQFCILDSTNI